MIFRKIISCLCAVLFATAIVAALFFAPLVKQHFPGFSTLLFISWVVLFAGTGYAIIERNVTIGILAALMTMLIPFIGTMLEGYWSWVRCQLHAFFG